MNILFARFIVLIGVCSVNNRKDTFSVYNSSVQLQLLKTFNDPLIGIVIPGIS